jgi:hypothetical protein
MFLAAYSSVFCGVSRRNSKLPPLSDFDLRNGASLSRMIADRTVKEVCAGDLGCLVFTIATGMFRLHY